MVGTGFHDRGCLSCHKTDARRKRNIYHTSGAKQERGARENIVTGHWPGVIITSPRDIQPGNGFLCPHWFESFVHAWAQQTPTSGESFEEKWVTKMCKGGAGGDWWIINVRNYSPGLEYLHFSLSPSQCWWSLAQANGLTSSVHPRPSQDKLILMITRSHGEGSTDWPRKIIRLYFLWMTSLDPYPGLVGSHRLPQVTITSAAAASVSWTNGPKWSPQILQPDTQEESREVGNWTRGPWHPKTVTLVDVHC